MKTHESAGRVPADQRRFIANKSSFEFKNKQITEMAEKLKGAVEAHQKKKEQEKKEKEAKEKAEKEPAAEDKKEA